MNGQTQPGIAGIDLTSLSVIDIESAPAMGELSNEQMEARAQLCMADLAAVLRKHSCILGVERAERFINGRVEIRANIRAHVIARTPVEEEPSRFPPNPPVDMEVPEPCPEEEVLAD